MMIFPYRVTEKFVLRDLTKIPKTEQNLLGLSNIWDLSQLNNPKFGDGVPN